MDPFTTRVSHTLDDMSNTTAPPYMSMAMLYADTDFSKLSWLELQYASFYLWIDNPVIATGLLSFLLHEVNFNVHASVLRFLQLTTI